MSLLTSLKRSRNTLWLRGCDRVGEEPDLRGRPTIEIYGGHIRIGDRFRLTSRPVASHLAAGPQGVLEIGDDVLIAHGAAIAAFQRVEIGDGTMIGPFVIIMDTNFHGSPGGQTLQHDTRPVIIGKRCRIGSRVTITKGASIGDDVEILAGGVVSLSVPQRVWAGRGAARDAGPRA